LRSSQENISRTRTEMPNPHLLGPTVETYFAARGGKGRYWEELEDRFERHIVPELGGRERLVATITKADLRKAIQVKLEEGKPVAARTLYESLSPFFKWLEGEDIILSNPLRTIIPPKIPESRERTLSKGELKVIYSISKNNLGNLWGPYFQFLMLTLQRRNEVSGIQYLEIEGGTWTIPGPRTKNGKTHLVPLSTTAQGIIDSKAEFIGRGVSGYSKVKARLDRLSGVKDWRVHDLRRTGATILQELGVQETVIEAILNHSPKGVKGVYQRYKYFKERKEALELLGLYLECL
jgi:integrase